MSILEHVVLGFFLSRFLGGSYHEASQHQQIQVQEIVFKNGLSNSQVQCGFDGHAGRYPSVNDAVLLAPARVSVPGPNQEWEAENGVQSYDRVP